MALYGTDQSKWQSNSVTEGDFIIVKATEGLGYVDPTCDIKYQMNKKAGKLRAFYHFARPDLGNSAQAEAKFFVDNCKNYFGDAIPVLDWERSVSNVGWAKAFLDEVFRLTGVRPWIYMSASVVNGYDWSSVASDYGLWIAGYPAKYNVKNPPKPTAKELPYKIGKWKFAVAWQYSSSAGTLDRNIFYGDATAWNKYAAKPATVEVPAPAPEPVVVPDPVPEEKPATNTPTKKNGSDASESQSTDTGLTLEEYDNSLAKIQESIELVTDTAKKYGLTFTMSNKVYDALKIIVAVVLPVISTLYVGLANIWGFGFGEQVDKTIQLIIAAINAILGIAIVKSSSDYHKQ